MAKGRRNYSSNGNLKEESNKAKITKESLREALILFKYIKPYRVHFYLALICLALSAISTSAFPFLLGKMIDVAAPGASAAMPGGNLPVSFSSGLKEIQWSLQTTILLIFAQLGIQMIFSYLRIYLLTGVGERSLADLRRDVYTKLLTQPMSYFTEKRVGELSSRISSDLSQIQDAISFTFAEFLRGIFTLIIGLAFIFWISVKLALVMLAVVPIVAVVAVIFGMRIRKMSRKAQDQLAESGTIVQETFQGIAAVKAFTGEAFEIQRYIKSITSVVNTAIQNARYRGAFVSVMIFSVFGAIAYVMYVGAGMIQTGELTTGLLTMFVIFSVFVGGTFAGFADMFSQLQKTLGATQSVREILRSDGEAVELNDFVVEEHNKLKGQISMHGVGFSYPSRKDIEVLKHITLEIRPGEQVAIVGSSGAGKSTLAALLLRYYDPTHGEIQFDGKNSTAFPLSQLRKQMAYVPQDIMLFGGSIRENIAYGKPNATESEIIAASKAAHAHEFIDKFPEGYETLVGERGIKLSGGQRQRVAIARAILKNPVLLILDEATSSLDSESEQLVQDALENLMKNRTSFVIAHRLSTIRNADKIIVIDKGTVTETGTHEALMESNGLYRRLNEMQFEFGSTAGEVKE
ncbi:MAG: ABC transporter transmembrane domain-containing protein [Bacteroidia bacterium]|jgi:ABC-type multidrug transport system fused ATPase/permease subunit